MWVFSKGDCEPKVLCEDMDHRYGVLMFVKLKWTTGLVNRVQLSANNQLQAQNGGFQMQHDPCFKA